MPSSNDTSIGDKSPSFSSILENQDGFGDVCAHRNDLLLVSTVIGSISYAISCWCADANIIMNNSDL